MSCEIYEAKRTCLAAKDWSYIGLTLQALAVFTLKALLPKFLCIYNNLMKVWKTSNILFMYSLVLMSAEKVSVEIKFPSDEHTKVFVLS